MNITELAAKPTEELVDQLQRLETSTGELPKNIMHEEALYRLLIGYAADQGILLSSGVLEIANSGAIIKGGGIAHRFARKMARDIKIPIRKQPSNVEHIAVDIEHANLLFQVIKDHVKTREDEQLVLSGAAKGLAVNAAWLGFLARDMEILR